MPVVVTPTWEPDPYARVQIVAQNIESDTATVWRRGGALPGWQIVRSGYNINTATGALRVYDYEMPICGEDPIQYAVTAGTTPATTPDADITIAADMPWLRHLGKPMLSRPVIVATIDGIERPGRLGTYEIVGRRDPVTVHDVRGSRRGTITFLARNAEESGGLRTLTVDGAPLLLQLSCCGLDFADCYMALDNITETRVHPNSQASNHKKWTFNYTEVARPSGEVPIVPGRTWADVLAGQPTWNEVRTVTPTWIEVLLGNAETETSIAPTTTPAG